MEDADGSGRKAAGEWFSLLCRGSGLAFPGEVVLVFPFSDHREGIISTGAAQAV